MNKEEFERAKAYARQLARETGAKLRRQMEADALKKT